MSTEHDSFSSGAGEREGDTNQMAIDHFLAKKYGTNDERDFDKVRKADRMSEDKSFSQRGFSAQVTIDQEKLEQSPAKKLKAAAVEAIPNHLTGPHGEARQGK